MKKFLPLLLIAFLFVFFLSACTPTFAHTIVQLPDQVQIAILAGVTLILTYVVNAIAVRIPWLGQFLGQYVLEASAAVAGAIALYLQNLLNMIPPQWEGVGNAFMVLVVAVLAALHVVTLVAKVRASFRKV